MNFIKDTLKYRLVPLLLQPLFIFFIIVLLIIYINFNVSQSNSEIGVLDFFFIGLSMMISTFYYFFMIAYILVIGLQSFTISSFHGKLMLNKEGFDMSKYILGFKEYVNTLKDRLKFHAQDKTDVELEYLSYAVALDLIENPFNYNLDNIVDSKEEIKNLNN